MILTVHAKPNSSQTKVKCWLDSATVCIDLCAPPIDGKANTELIDFLSKKLNIAKSFISIKRGQSGRVKHISLPDNVDLKLLQG